MTSTKDPKGFRFRRGQNWIVIGLLYASFYMCRYNFRFAVPGIQEEFGFDVQDVSFIFSTWSLAYGVGQVLNGLLADGIGGRKSMLIGAVGTISINVLFGFSPMISHFFSFAILALMNGYFQSFGAPGMVKMNAAWFRITERGSFAGIFGGMIQLGQVSISHMAAAALLFLLVVKETPDEAGYPKVVIDEIDDSEGVKVPAIKSFRTIFFHPYIWFYAFAYACTGGHGS